MKTGAAPIQTGVSYAKHFRKERGMLKLMKECAPWLTWKVGALFAAVVLVAGIAFGAEAGLLAFRPNPNNRVTRRNRGER
jgi:hypothetical protein